MRTAILFLILIFLIDMVFGLGLRFYRILYFDVILHFFGGFFVAMFFYDYLKEYTEKKASKLKKLLIITGATVFIGVIWEFSEYIASYFLSDYLLTKYNLICCMGNLNDTVNDLLMDIIGAIAFMILRDKS